MSREVHVFANHHAVAELQQSTGLEASHLSQHLAVLRRHRLVLSDRRASHVYYRIAEPEVAELLGVARRLLAAVVATDTRAYAALDDLPDTAGQVTTAQAMGDNLLHRLQAVGISFEVLD